MRLSMTDGCTTISTGELDYDTATHGAVYNGGDYQKGGYFTTYSGVRFRCSDPGAWELINIEDIAQSLSNSCRFNGHVTDFYSVAQHSVLVSLMCDPRHALEGLLHDAQEAYLGDVIRPLKETAMFEAYRTMEAKLERDVARRFGLAYPMHPSIKAADMEVVVYEASVLYRFKLGWIDGYLAEHPLVLMDKLAGCGRAGVWPFTPWAPVLARQMFLNRYEELTIKVV